MSHQSSCRIQEADVAGLLPHQGSLLHLWQVCTWSYGKGWSLSAWLCFPTYVMRWLSRFLKHVFPRSRSNARAYSRVLSPSTSGSSLPYPIPPCTSLYPVPAWPTWPFQSPHGSRNSDAGILAVTARSWSKNRSLTSTLRPLCGAHTYRKVTTHWLTIDDSFGDSLQFKNFLYSIVCHKHSNTSSAFVISGPVELVSGVPLLDCEAVAKSVAKF